jgi:hypothetical protein
MALLRASAITICGRTSRSERVKPSAVEVQPELVAVGSSPAVMLCELGFHCSLVCIVWQCRSASAGTEAEQTSLDLVDFIYGDGGLVVVTLRAAAITIVTIRCPGCRLGRKDADQAGHAGAVVGAVAVRDLVEVLLVVVLGGLTKK